MSRLTIVTLRDELAAAIAERDAAQDNAALLLQVITSVSAVLGVDENALAEDPSLAIATAARLLSQLIAERDTTQTSVSSDLYGDGDTR